MIACKHCGYEGPYVGKLCPSCHAEFKPNAEEVTLIREELESALKNEDFIAIAECRHILADLGETAAERDYAMMLEQGGTVTPDPENASRYYARAAAKNDPVAAYRYSRLAARASDASSVFWLRYSAVLGCTEAYFDVAESFAAEGKEDRANYFYMLAAEEKNTDAAVTLVRRFLSGTGCEISEAHAKYYLDKFTFPPLQLLKTAYKLRGVKPQKPEETPFRDYDAYLADLLARAIELHVGTAALTLAKILAERGNMRCEYLLGTFYMEGVGTAPDLNVAYRHLITAGTAGVADAFLYLAKLFLAGNRVSPDVNRALEYFRKAAELGISTAYGSMADIYSEGKLIPRDIARAINLYDLAAKDGDEASRVKSEALKDKREHFYQFAKEMLASSPEDAYRSFAIATAMGYLPAYRELGRCYEEGIGTETDRGTAVLWYEKALEAGDAEALYPLGRCYAHGIGVRFSFRHAADLLTRAAKRGNEDAKAELLCLCERKRRRMVRKLFAGGMELLYQKKFAEAAKLMEAVADLGDPQGMYTYGCFLEFGIGTQIRRERAFALYEQAYQGKFRDPRQTYKLRILKMIR